MKEILKKWEIFAKADLDVAQRLFDSPKPTHRTYLLVLWHCHQAIEKMLKRIIIAKEKELLKIHDLLKLVNLSEIDLSEEKKEFLKDLNEFYLRSRYPDLLYKPLPQPNKKFTQKYFNFTKKMFLWLKKQI